MRKSTLLACGPVGARSAAGAAQAMGRQFRQLTGETYGRPRLSKENPGLDGYGEWVVGVLYDSFTVASNTAWPTVTEMFQTPVGGTKTKSQTNLRQIGVLENWDIFQVTGYGVWISNDTVPNDVLAIYKNTFFSFYAGVKAYLEGPPQIFPAGFGASLSAVAQTGTAPATSATPFLSSNGIPSLASLFTFGEAPVNILTGESFGVTVTATTAFSTQNAGNPAGAGSTIMVVLFGYRGRKVQ